MAMHPFRSLLFLFLLFLFMVVAGTLLLLIPCMHVGPMPFIDSFFTTVSALTNSGLVTTNVAKDFTCPGHLLILFLVKFGGFTSICAGALLLQWMGHDKYANALTIKARRNIFLRIFLWTTVVELAFAWSLFYFWPSEIAWRNEGERWFTSIFHSVSIFNHSGFSIFPEGVSGLLRDGNYLMQWIFITEAFIGSLGFLAIYNLFSKEQLRKRLMNPAYRINGDTRTTLYFLAVVTGASVMTALANVGINAHQLDVFGKITTAVFSAIVTSTCGYSDPFTSGNMQWLMLGGMFIGGSIASASGGIRIQNLSILVARIRSRFYRESIVRKWGQAVTSFQSRLMVRTVIIYCSMIIAGTLLLVVFEWPGSGYAYFLSSLLKNEVVAVCTGGYHIIDLSQMSTGGCYIIAMSMLCGRLGLFIIAYSLWKGQAPGELST
jgi:trk system potassium uptake protein